ncbi:alkali-sensitive linkage protein 1 [Colletotrichum liriopes]|uniref:Alkali-sensitive linkage protein 1 n=1 Tax=Colletotrichum liriopes TaxID=708192 RepID=A0AA37H0U9_9PEZI|nr:alkali-sensitive linkage protein 1 [Colletotrichum liriopes]
MSVARILIFFTLFSLAKRLLAFDGRMCFPSALPSEKLSHGQCSCANSGGPFATLSTSAPETAPASSGQAQPTSFAPSRLDLSALGSKRGLAYNDANLVNKFTDNKQCTECSWAYNWDSTDNGLVRHSLDFVPMLWSPQEEHTRRWPQNADAMLLSGSTHILSFNECDRPDQCNLDAASAAAAHVEYVNSYAGRARIGSPAISNSAAAGQGLRWLELWVWACDGLGCEYDFCAAHWYGNSVEDLLKHVASVHEICRGKPVWLTEFAIDVGSDEQHAAFITAVAPQLDAVGYLERYAYFMIQEGRFIFGSTITSSGQAYAEA